MSVVGWVIAFGMLGQFQATVYLGELDGADKPAALVAQTVFDEIPEYKEIKKRGLDEDDSEYWVLLARANERFYAAVKSVADARGYDVVIERGTHSFDEEPPDITKKVIRALKE
jgi:hypothetical protein